MINFSLQAISPIDGRYHQVTKSLSAYFSEFALIKYRLKVELEYYKALSNLGIAQLGAIKESDIISINKIYENFSEADAQRIKDIEKITNHDVKAVEYFIKEQFALLQLPYNTEFVHFGLTSQDINNTAIPLSIKDYLHESYFPSINNILKILNDYATQWQSVPMLARTHGQPASPTILGKEIKVFIERIENQIKQLHELPMAAKFGGATGNFNAHFVSFPNIDWIHFSNEFVNNTLGLKRMQYTTQIEHYDYLAALFDTQKRINTILIDFCRDIWQYISVEYFKQKINTNEVGSSAMPHKVNPIDFENAEGNLGIANAVLEHLSAKLPISRLQRDLTDSTVLRNIGVPMAHIAIACNSLQKGLLKLNLNEAALHLDLENNWMVVSEAIQTILRRENFDKPYEALKALTRKNSKITQQDFIEFINSLDITDAVKAELLGITPFNYTGIYKAQ